MRACRVSIPKRRGGINMKLLILTQTVNTKDPILGFFHGWILEMAGRFEKISVICLYEGEHNLPKNVSVYSLGKESGVSKFKYIKKFFKYTWMLRKEYSSVLVHMNEEYVLLGGLLWKLLGKKIVMWRNHKSGSWKTQIAGALSDKVCYTSTGSYTSRFKNGIVMPVGIDQNLFRSIESIERKKDSFLYVGRISPIKNVEAMIDGFVAFHKENPELDFTFNLVGPADSDLDRGYKKDLEQKVAAAGLDSKISFSAAVPQSQLPELYSRHQFCINLTASGSFDKTIWESVFCGCVPVVHNTSFLDEIPADVRAHIAVEHLDPQNVAGDLKQVIFLENKEVIIGRLLKIAEKHSLAVLVQKLTTIL